ncbi:DUF1963 domain-containing protein [Metabacillus iocasae]|uniref:Uncharacterized protein YwqG n=1 Tax=Priestia iocasae TaxID=2291674 RepID=A0ABS2QRK2_9BACI|nr:uncharacterized protein YwqG [Metabacillus iocasae]
MEWVGLDFDIPTKQANFRVIYHSEVITDLSKLMNDFSFMDELDLDSFPIQHEMKLSFKMDEEPVSMTDFQSEPLPIDFDESVSEDLVLWDVYEEAFSGDGSKIGGYGFFTQQDPRSYGKKYKGHSVMLLQIDSDDDAIIWGDSGVANFFITQEDLKSRNFTNVLYNWDCY